MQAGTGSWFWGIDNWGIYSVPSLVQSGLGPVSVHLSGASVVLTWTAAPNVHLQQSSSLAPANWTDVLSTLGLGTYTSGVTNQGAFYRLIGQ